jgi:DNA-binding CsgD family transcriptional regulator
VNWTKVSETVDEMLVRNPVQPGQTLLSYMKQMRQTVERMIIERALQTTFTNAEAARELGITENGLRTKMNRLLINRGKETVRVIHKPEEEKPGLVMKVEVQLTQRDQVMLEMMSRGYTYTQIGKLLGRKRTTIEGWASRMRDKIGADNITHAVAIAYRAGWLKVEEFEDKGE